MYFMVKYIEFPKFNSQSEPLSKSPSNDHIAPLNVEKARDRTHSLAKSSRKNIRSSVAYESAIESSERTVAVVDDNKEVLVNPDCFLGSIIDYIREVAAIPKSKDFKMCTLDGDVTEFSTVLSTPGLEYFLPKQTYYIIFEEQDVSGIEVRIPLLSKCTELYSKLLLKLKQVPSVIQIQTRGSISKSSAKSKERMRSRRNSRKDVKSGFLPLIKQNNY